MTDGANRFPRNARATPKSVVAAAAPYKASASAIPDSYLAWPIEMSYWGNETDGDCCTAEEAFAKATAYPPMYFSDAIVIAWATANGFINGTTPAAAMTAMGKSGFQISGSTYDDGPYSAVTWTTAADLQDAIYTSGPVKLGVGAGLFQKGAKGSVTPGTSGWAMYDYPLGSPSDHCVSLCGYGTLAELVALFKTHDVDVKVPAGMPTGTCYAMFTWNSIGIIDQQSMLNMTTEAWARNPVTSINKPVSKSWWQTILSWF